jgi:hypothetical protein
VKELFTTLTRTKQKHKKSQIMKKAILTCGLFSMMMILTSFTSKEIGGQRPPGTLPYTNEIGGQRVPGDANPLGINEIGGQRLPGTVPIKVEIGGQRVPGDANPLG